VNRGGFENKIKRTTTDMEYNFRDIEKKWQKRWKESNVYKVENDFSKPKYYVLDMFPYPSGAGLHVGHPLGYIASDIYSRYKRLKGYNVLHPMGFDSFGLPAEQYALDTGQHPAETTKKNIATFKSQLDNIGFCYDWSREVQTSDPNYYKWTQWIFLQLFNSYYCHTEKKAKPISALIKKYETKGAMPKKGPFIPGKHFTAEQWKGYSKQQQEEILMNRRLAFSKFGEVNWCEALGTVLANDEVVNGVSERGGHPVEKKKMRQWYLRITSYADRLLEGLETVDFSDSMKEMQRNWIGKSEGAEIEFRVQSSESGVFDAELRTPESRLGVYTTRPDTIFGVDFMVLAPEHELVPDITTPAQKEAINNYLHYVKSRSDRERQAEVKQITGCFTGSYAINPFDGSQIPIWIAEYVLAGYGTGAIMGVPCGDQRDFAFAKHFNIPITNIIGEHYNGEEANPTKEANLQNSGFLNGLLMKDAIAVANNKIEELGIGKRKVNYKMRDAGFSRQRYWGEPFPIVWKNGIAYPLNESELPLTLPHVDSYKPGPDGQGPLANITEWTNISSPPTPLQGVERGAATVPKYSVYTPVQYELAKQMRKEHTEAEGVLWEVIRDSKLGVKFRRQHPIDKYIVDFICLQERLIVEADGGYHTSEEQKFYDAERTRVLNDIGFEVMRFTNEEIIAHPYKTKDKIKARIEQKRAESSPISPLHFVEKGSGVRDISPLHFVEKGSGVRETSTMPGYAGSSWYFLRYMDPDNTETFCDRKISDYWNQVDLYIGGTEHAVGHLLYSRMWTKVLFDLNLIGFDEPFKRLLNQGMIQGSSRFAYKIVDLELEDSNWPLVNYNVPSIFISNTFYRDILKNDENNEVEKSNQILQRVVKLINQYSDEKLSAEMILVLKIIPIHVDVNIVDGNELDIEAFKKSKPDYANAEFILEDGSLYSPLSTGGQGSGVRYICGSEVEKMSKSKFNTVNPDDLVAKYGADTFRMYEMFLGPVEMSKPWDTKGIEGVHRFLKKFWRLFFHDSSPLSTRGEGAGGEEEPTPAELKVLHNTIKKIEQDTERFSFNTAVSGFMIATNELTELKCHKRKILEPLLILLAPYAPHIAEELFAQLRTTPSPQSGEGRGEGHPWRGVGGEVYPIFEEKYVKESSKAYPVAINGKTRHEITLPLDITQQQVEETILKDEVVQKWLEGKPPKKIIYVKNKMINVVV
jgi:leucyl-tRNA synthetase